MDSTDFIGSLFAGAWNGEITAAYDNVESLYRTSSIPEDIKSELKQAVDALFRARLLADEAAALREP